MAEGMNKAYLIGNLGADAELRHYGGQAILKFRIATTETWKTKEGELKERTDWHRCHIWGTRAEKLAPHLTKGTSVFIEGAIQHSSYEKNGQKMYSTDIRVRDLKFMGAKKRDATNDGVDFSQAMQGQAAPPPYREANVAMTP